MQCALRGSGASCSTWFSICLSKFHPNGTTHGKVMTSMSYWFFNFSKLRPWSWKSTCGFGFSDSNHLAMYKSASTPNFDNIAQSTAVWLRVLLLVWENVHPPYWNYTSDRHGYWHFASAYQIWIFWLRPLPRYGGPKISKVVTQPTWT